ncbi:41275_t:CDS:2 [Gigaspora margarita]|uniref:41275_t:CDS:1 n=1 Tax=Gigaspora margarita TaxID=4874 RepID=A0ABM8W138_GIGMA|nr:41275_t:CDS:2 [Gigaspora margarita]
MVNAQTWLDQNYPANGICIRVEDKENYGKAINQIVNLDSNIDKSHNQLAGSNFALPSFSIKKLKFSYNSISAYYFETPNLAYLDVTSNLLTFLACLFNCLGVRFVSTSNVTPTSTYSSLSRFFQPQQSIPIIPHFSEVLLA